MQYANYRINLDVQAGGSGVVLSAKRGDTGRRLFVTLTDGGRPYVPEDDCCPILTARKPDGSSVLNQCALEGKLICCPLTEQLLAVPGTVRCELRIYGSGGMLLTSASFELLVEATVCSEEDIPESFDDFSALTDLISRNQELLKELQQLKENGGFKNGATFYPRLDSGGDLSWTNDGGLDNPQTVNIRGPRGEAGKTPVKGTDYCTGEDKRVLVETVLLELPEHGETVRLVAEALPKVEAIDFSDFENGSFTETADGKTITHTVTLDSEGRPVLIDDIVITWGASE